MFVDMSDTTEQADALAANDNAPFTRAIERVCDFSEVEIFEPNAASLLEQLAPGQRLDDAAQRLVLRDAADAGKLFPREIWRLQDEGFLPSDWRRDLVS